MTSIVVVTINYVQSLKLMAFWMEFNAFRATLIEGWWIVLMNSWKVIHRSVWKKWNETLNPCRLTGHRVHQPYVHQQSREEVNYTIEHALAAAHCIWEPMQKRKTNKLMHIFICIFAYIRSKLNVDASFFVCLTLFR